MSLSVKENELYPCYFAAQWQYLKQHVIDFEHGGIYEIGLDCRSKVRRRVGVRFAPAEFTRNGRDWKDAAHEGWAIG
jgi:hypothetical protein